MISDANLLFCNVQAVGTAAADTSEKSINLSAAGIDVGPGETIGVWARVDTAFDTMSYLDISLISSAAATLGTATTHWTKRVLLAGLTADTMLALPDVPAGIALQYLGLAFANDNADATGTLSAGLTIKSAKPQNNVVTS